MSTTVTYKGNTLTTVNNQTRTLKTAGKYMEGDVVLTDISESGTSANVWQDEQGYVHLDDEGEGSISVEALSVTQNGTYTAPTGTAYSPVTVNVSGGGGGSALDQVRFIDYDGSVVHSYSKSDFMALSAMPSNPTHTGLTSQGWNWSLADAKNYLTDYPDGDLTIGQMYITDDGKTRLYCHFEESRLHPYLSISPNGTVVVDWGDDSATSTLTGTSLNTARYADHEYASAGDYIITLTVLDGSFAFFGSSNTSNILKKDTTTSANIHQIYTNCIQKIEIGANVVRIGDYAFYNCSSLASITIPDGVTSISLQAFRSCYSLVSVTIPDGVTSIENNTFEVCYSLMNIAIPAGITSIGSYAFRACTSLTSITIPNGVTNIRNSTFNLCHALTNITIPDGVISIENDAFNNCQSLTNIAIPDKVTSIGTKAFLSCYSLTNITIPDGVTSIGISTFDTCTSLTSIIIPSSVTSIGTNAFYNCYSLTSIIIPSGVTSIGTNTFQNCQSLASVIIPSGVTSIGDFAFYNCSSLASIIIPSSITNIGKSAFYGCYSLADITIPDGVINIGNYAFQSCYSLISITIPNGIISIENGTFGDCKSLANITVPNGVTNIGTYAFSGCYGMAKYHFLSTTPPTLADTNAFRYIQPDCIIYVPQGSLEAYQTATNWSTYASYMQEESA